MAGVLKLMIAEIRERARRSKESAAFWRRRSVGWVPAKIKRLSIVVVRRHR